MTESKQTLRDKKNKNFTVHLSEQGCAVLRQIFEPQSNQQVKEKIEQIHNKHQGDDATVLAFKIGIIYGNVWAYGGLATCYIQGLGVEQSNPKGQEILEMASSSQSINAIPIFMVDAPKPTNSLKQDLFKVGYNLYMAARYEEALPYFRAAAVRGGKNRMDALDYLSICYASGFGVKQNIDRSNQLDSIPLVDKILFAGARILELTADIGGNSSSYALGLLEQGHYYIQGKDRHQKRAVQCYMNAKKGGNEAHFFLGLCYLQGIGVECNVFTAINYFKAAAHHLKAAQYVLAWCYQLGIGTEELL
jgi:TPR repeat protein